MFDRSSDMAAKTTRGRTWRNVGHGWRWAITVVLVGVIGASLTSVNAFGQFMSSSPKPARKPVEALIRVRSKPPQLVFSIHGNEADYATVQRMQVELIRSRIVLAPVLRNPKMARLATLKAQTDPLTWLEGQLRVGFTPGTELLTIGLDLADRVEAATIVNAVVDSYMEVVVGEARKLQIARLESLRKLLGRYQDELKEKRRVMQALAGTSGTVDRATVERRMKRLSDDLEDGRKELRRVRLEKTAVEARTALRKGNAETPALELRGLEDQLAVFSAQEKMLVKEAEAITVELQKLPGPNIDVATERTEIQVLQKTADTIGREVEALDIELQAPSRVSPLSPAQ